MKRALVGLAVCLALVSICFAQQNPADAPASKEDIQKYLDTVHTRALLDNMFGAMTQAMHRNVHDMVAKQPNLPADFESRMDKMMDDILKDFPVDDYLEVMIPVYQKHLSKGDVDALVAFYSTPTGQKILKELPAITTEAMQATTPLTQKLMWKAMGRAQEEIAQAMKDADSSKKPQTN